MATRSPSTERKGPGEPTGFAELIARTGTPIHLATPETELNTELFMAVTTELGDVVLRSPGTTPADLAEHEGT